jgi:CheY-like chemotaxis protein
MSHELRTPLSAILGLVEVLKGGIYGPLNQKQLKSMGNIEESGRHLLALINDILDLSKIGAGKLELQIGQVPVVSVCQASLRLIEETAHKKQIKVSSSLDNTVTILQADERRLKQILVNLLSNAVKFTPEGGAVGLEVVGHTARQEVDFTVWDTGIGIPAEGTERLFQPFVQLDSPLSRQFAGTGLGLALVQRMAELHNGRLSVESDIGQGSRFTVSLPWTGLTQSGESVEPAAPSAPTKIELPDIGQESPPPENEPASPQELQPALVLPQGTDRAAQTRPSVPDQKSPEPGPSPAESPLILLVEDDENMSTFIMSYLLSKNYRVDIAWNGVEAIEQARQNRPDVILMDIQMPEMDGLEATLRIRADADQRLATIPIIALTALAMSGDREQCLEAGADDYLSKPIKLRDLIQAIEIQLNKNRITEKGLP